MDFGEYVLPVSMTGETPIGAKQVGVWLAKGVADRRALFCLAALGRLHKTSWTAKGC